MKWLEKKMEEQENEFRAVWIASILELICKEG